MSLLAEGASHKPRRIAVLPCAPLARQCVAQARRTAKSFWRSKKAMQKARPPAPKFFQLFFKTPLRALRRCAKLAAFKDQIRFTIGLMKVENAR